MSTSSIADVPSTFLAGFRTRLTNDTLLLLWNNRSDTEKAQVTKAASVGAPPASFLPNVNITSLTREAAWLALTDAQRALYADGTAAGATTGPLLGGNAQTNYKATGFGSQIGSTASTTSALPFTTAKLDEVSQTPTTATSVAYRAIWKEDADFADALADNGTSGDSNGGAVFVTIRAGTGAERATNPYTDDTTVTTDNYDRYEKLVTSLAKTVTDRFGTSQALLGYDVNDNGYIDSEAELFGFDAATAGLDLATANLASSRLMVLTASGASVRVNQSVYGTDVNNGTGYLPYTTAYTVLQQDASGKLELVVESTAGVATAPEPPMLAWAASASGQLGGGDNLDIVVNFSKDVTVTGTDSTLDIDIGGVTVQATYLSSSGSTATYRYAVQATDLDTDGITIAANGLTLNSSTIKDANGFDADLTLASVTRTQTTVGTAPPTILSTSLATGNFRDGDTLTVTVEFNKPVNFDTSAEVPPGLTLDLDVGGVTRAATLSSVPVGAVTSATFTYTVQAADADADGVTIGSNAITLNGATIRDNSGNDLSLTNTTLASSGAVVDNTAPSATTFDVPVAVYDRATTDTIPITITFDENISTNLTSATTLDFQVGGVTLTAAYQSRTLNSITFGYQLTGTDPTGSIDFTGVDSVVFGGGETITDAAGNPLPTPLTPPAAVTGATVV